MYPKQSGKLASNRSLISWTIYAAVISIGACLFYDNEWREFSHLTVIDAWLLRLTAILTILLTSFAANLIAKIVPIGRHIQAFLSGLLTGISLKYFSGWIGNHFLGGYAHFDLSFGRLMSEGWGMVMYEWITPLTGILAFIRAEFDQ